MVNILLEGYDIAAEWLKAELGRIILPRHRVAVAAFAFRDDRVRNAQEWERLYGRDGMYSGGIAEGFAAYGIARENLRFLNYFADSRESAAQAVREADIVYFPGGLPDRMMQRMEEFALVDVLRQHDGIVMGYSAGAVIQLAEYHLSPDADYPQFGYYAGLSYLDNFYLEVHYEGNDVQKQAIRRVLTERGKRVYATQKNAGALLVENGAVRCIGDVKGFDKVDDVR